MRNLEEIPIRLVYSACCVTTEKFAVRDRANPGFVCTAVLVTTVMVVVIVYYVGNKQYANQVWFVTEQLAGRRDDC